MTAETVVLSAIEVLLAEERLAVRLGDLGTLDALAARKADILERLAAEASAAPHETLARVKELAAANQTLLSAALDGLRSARARLTAIRDASSRFDTYDRAGRAHSVSLAQGTVERRA
ncbi:hypothetical protein DEA8626_02517 [Defluviimonas aquaemixtae]|uniref:FlgN protein n=1 Tax=Albidovulum aquaemixtae TaxID=1542388 RepID=A0A2R8BJA7_9RHOB|nr:hypothetical protein [Defluviimonas aquaemixtae]SPH23454.1 hypothetical protein DEA8626_02517 [Defluviimonas aquaemixtae]